MVVAGAMHGWSHNATECASVVPRPRRPDGSYDHGHTTGVGVRSYAAVVVAWSMCGRVRNATECLPVESRPGRPLGGRRVSVGLTTKAGSDVGRRST